MEADRDHFELHLRNLLNQQLGPAFVAGKVLVKFHEIDEAEVCQVDVAAAKQPLIITVKDKSGVATQKFYVRSGNSSQEIPMSEMTAYVKDRFN